MVDHHFEILKYLRIVVGLVEDGFKLFLKQNLSNFVTHELSPDF